ICHDEPPTQINWRQNAKLEDCRLRTGNSILSDGASQKPILARGQTSKGDGTFWRRRAPLRANAFELVLIQQLIHILISWRDEGNGQVILRRGKLARRDALGAALGQPHLFARQLQAAEINWWRIICLRLLARVEARDAPFGGNPDEAVVVAEDRKNYVPRQAILRREVRPLIAVRVKAVQPAVRSKIDSARPVFCYGAHRVARQLPLFVRVIEKRRIVCRRLLGYRHSFVAQANPQPAAAVLKKRTRVGFRQPC